MMNCPQDISGYHPRFAPHTLKAVVGWWWPVRILSTEYTKGYGQTVITCFHVKKPHSSIQWFSPSCAPNLLASSAITGAWDVSKCKQGGGETRQWWTARRRYLVTTPVLHHTLLKPRPAAAQCSGRQWSECFCQRQGIWFSSERPENATRTSAWQGKVRPLGVRTPEKSPGTLNTQRRNINSI